MAQLDPKLDLVARLFAKELAYDVIARRVGLSPEEVEALASDPGVSRRAKQIRREARDGVVEDEGVEILSPEAVKFEIDRLTVPAFRVIGQILDDADSDPSVRFRAAQLVLAHREELRKNTDAAPGNVAYNLNITDKQVAAMQKMKDERAIIVHSNGDVSAEHE